MNGQAMVEGGSDTVGALVDFLAAHPGCGVAAVGPDGVFVEMPPEVPVGDHPGLGGKAGIALVAAESRSEVLEQFRQLPSGGATDLEVVLSDGSPGRYALFDTRTSFGVIVLAVVRGTQTGRIAGVDHAELDPARTRYGAIRRTEVAELLSVDEAVLQMTGYDAETFASMTTSELVHPDDQDAVVNQWFDMLGAGSGQGRRSRVRYRRADGSWLWIELSVTNHLDDPDDPHVLSELVDISDEMAAMDEVWQHRELLARLTAALPVGVAQVDGSGGVVYGNERLAQIVGVDDALTFDQQFATIVDEDRDELDRAVEQALGEGVDSDLEARFRPAGAPVVRYCQLSVRALRDRADLVTGAVICVADVTDSTRMRKELEMRATFDVLTRCYNRATVMAEIERALTDRRGGVAVVFVDLDRFKQVNDERGHAAGDALLVAVADALRGATRAHDVVGRLGGDEFVVLCRDVPERSRALEIADRVAEALRFEADVGGVAVPVRASIGVAWAGGAGATAEALVASADAAMYDSKRAGGNRPVMAKGVPPR